MTDTPSPAATTSLSLAGPWNYALDAGDRGIDERWFKGHPAQGVMELPGTTDTAGIGLPPAAPLERALTRRHRHLGPAWYSREIDIPAGWAGQRVSLFLERVIFESRAWIDGSPVGVQDSLVTPHVHPLGRLSTGRHTLTVCVDNRMVQPIGVDGHGYTEFTQTIWNGAVGRIELRAQPSAALGPMRTFPDAARCVVDVEVAVDNSDTVPVSGTLALVLREQETGRSVGTASIPVDAPPGSRTVRATVRLDEPPRPWDEFTPALYRLHATLDTPVGTDTASAGLGFRSLSSAGGHITVNGRRTFMRGTMDHCVFPHTGHPPMDVAGWRHVLALYRSYGLNQVRFHSWTPPEAAFQAADELGMYLQPEITWLQYPYGSGLPLGELKTLGRGELPPSFSYSDRSPDAFVRAEMRRVVDTYGNHPSFVLFALGNELGASVWEVTGRWIAEEKEHDPRRLYAAATARAITPHDDFADTHHLPGIGRVRDRVEPSNDWDYEELYAAAPVPVIAHELGQWPTYPDWAEIGKYTGVLSAPNLAALRDQAEEAGVLAQNGDFRRASGALAVRLYKDQMESHLRTRSCQGFSTLGMQDYPGQGEALVGWVDSFLDSKGTVTAERFRRWCSETVPLARLSSYVVTAGEPVAVTAELAHYGAEDLALDAAGWRLLDAASGHVLCEGGLAAAVAPTGTASFLGDFTIPTAGLPAPAQVRLEVFASADGRRWANDWDLWLLPAAPDLAVPPGVAVLDYPDDARRALARGQDVLLLAHRLGEPRNQRLAAFKPTYWSATYFPGSETLGALVDRDHPALALFPTEGHYDWQWFDLCERGRGFALDPLPQTYRPIVQPVPDFHRNARLGTIFELATESGGRLLVCGYDIDTDLAHRPAARQLRASLLAYMASPAFHPDTLVCDQQLSALLPGAAGPAATGDGVLLRHSVAESAPQVAEAGFACAISPDWTAETVEVRITLPRADLYRLRVRLKDGGGAPPCSVVLAETRCTTGPDGWASLDISREDCLGGVLVVRLQAEAGTQVKLGELVLLAQSAY